MMARGTKIPACCNGKSGFIMLFRKSQLFAAEMVRNSEVETTFGATTCENFATVGC